MVILFSGSKFLFNQNFRENFQIKIKINLQAKVKDNSLFIFIFNRKNYVKSQRN